MHQARRFGKVQAALLNRVAKGQITETGVLIDVDFTFRISGSEDKFTEFTQVLLPQQRDSMSLNTMDAGR